MRIRSVILGLLGLVLVGAGIALVAAFFVIQNPTSSTVEGYDDVAPTIDTENKAEDPDAPEDKTLTVTIPKMSRIENDAVPDTVGDDEEALKDYAAIHLKGTGFPWEEEANVYLAGHRLGYPGTESFLAFYDQDKLEEGDEIFITDSEGREYIYRVFESFVVNPTDLWVIDPVPGKNIVTLQTCTLPDYSQRIITRAELVSKA